MDSRLDFEMYAGDDKSIIYRVKTYKGVIVDVTSATFTFMIKSMAYSLEDNTESIWSGVPSVEVGAEGTIKVVIPSALSKDFPQGTWAYDIQMTLNSIKTTVAVSTVRVKARVRKEV